MQNLLVFISAGWLLGASACVASLDAGIDGKGGSASASNSTSPSTSSATGGGSSLGGPSALGCQMPAVPQCAWGYPGGPCGSDLPGNRDCYAGYVCAGATSDMPGTCVTAADAGGDEVAVQAPGGPCGPDYISTLCPWNYECSADDSTGPASPDGICVRGGCVLGGGTVPASGASVTVLGDGPTQSFAYGTAPGSYAGKLTGEAFAYESIVDDEPEDVPVHGFILEGSVDPSGIGVLGTLYLEVPALTVGPVAGWSFVWYVPAWNPWSGDPYPGSFYSIRPANAPPKVTLTAVDDAHVAGTFDAELTDEYGNVQGTKHITGSFDVCRLPAYYGYHISP